MVRWLVGVVNPMVAAIDGGAGVKGARYLNMYI